MSLLSEVHNFICSICQKMIMKKILQTIYIFLKGKKIIRSIYFFFKKEKFLFKKKEFIRRNHTVYFGKNVQILGMDYITIGENTCIGDDCWINVSHRPNKDNIVLNPSIIIGKCSFIGRRNFITVGNKVIIGDFFLSSVDCSFIGASHLFEENKPYILGEVDNVNNIIIGCNVFIGAHTKVIGNVSIGYGSLIGANTTVLKDIPPFSMVVGSESRVIKRYNFEKKQWDRPENINIELYPSEEEYRNKLLENYPVINKIRHAASSKEGWL